jgi:hypothetical protein
MMTRCCLSHAARVGNATRVRTLICAGSDVHGNAGVRARCARRSQRGRWTPRRRCWRRARRDHLVWVRRDTGLELRERVRAAGAGSSAAGIQRRMLCHPTPQGDACSDCALVTTTSCGPTAALWLLLPLYCEPEHEPTRCHAARTACFDLIRVRRVCCWTRRRHRWRLLWWMPQLRAGWTACGCYSLTSRIKGPVRNRWLRRATDLQDCGDEAELAAIVQLLLEHGADLEARNTIETSLHVGCRIFRHLHCGAASATWCRRHR